MTDSDLVEAVNDVAAELSKSGHDELALELKRTTVKATVDMRKLEKMLVEAALQNQDGEKFADWDDAMAAIRGLVEDLEPGMSAYAEQKNLIDNEQDQGKKK